MYAASLRAFTEAKQEEIKDAVKEAHKQASKSFSTKNRSSKLGPAQETTELHIALYHTVFDAFVEEALASRASCSLLLSLAFPSLFPLFLFLSPPPFSLCAWIPRMSTLVVGLLHTADESLSVNVTRFLSIGHSFNEIIQGGLTVPAAKVQRAGGQPRAQAVQQQPQRPLSLPEVCLLL